MSDLQFMILDPQGAYLSLDHMQVTTIAWEDPGRKIIRITQKSDHDLLSASEDLLEFTVRLARFVQALEYKRMDVALKLSYPPLRILN